MVSRSTAVAVILGLAAVTAGAVAVAYASKVPSPPPSPPPPTLSTLSLSVSPNPAPTNSTVTFTLKATDSSGNPVANVQAQLINQANNTVVSTFPATNSSGISSITATTGSEATTITYIAQSGSIKSNSVTLTVQPTTPLLASLTLTASATSVSVGTSITLTVKAIGSGGLPLPGVSPTLLENGTSIGTFSPTSGEGISSLTATPTAAGTYTFQAVDGNIKSNTVTVTVTSTTTSYFITISASPTSLPATGGTVTISGNSNLPANTSGYVRTENIGTAFNTPFITDSFGNFSVNINIPANTSGSSRNVQFNAYATVSGVTVKSPAVYVTQAG
jgi:hypothetical protein